MRRSLILATIGAALSVGTALATPPSNATGEALARATFDGIAVAQAPNQEAAIQEITIAPGGQTGWHTHPGAVVIMVRSGTFSFYDATCARTDTPVGGGAQEQPGQVGLAMNNGSQNLVLTVLYFGLAPGGPLRHDAPAPVCAAGAGLPTGSGPSGIGSSVVVQRSTFPEPAAITGGDGRDVVLQRITIAPGGHSGWHSHPGSVAIWVASGTFTVYNAGCVRQQYEAGEGVVEGAGHVILARNEGTVPVTTYAASFDVPVGGAARNDQPEPLGCTGLAPVAAGPATTGPTTGPTTAPTRSSVPNTATPATEGSAGALALVATAVLLVSLGLLAGPGLPRRSRSG